MSENHVYLTFWQIENDFRSVIDPDFSLKSGDLVYHKIRGNRVASDNRGKTKQIFIHTGKKSIKISRKQSPRREQRLFNVCKLKYVNHIIKNLQMLIKKY